jgi:signal transduction histidine kinase
LTRTTFAAESPRFIGAWDDLRVEPAADLHPDLHPRPSVPSSPLALARLVGLVAVDVEVALTHEHTGPVALLVVLAVLANVAALLWLSGRPQVPSIQAGALTLLAFAGGLLGALQHGSPALAFPAVALVQAVASDSVLEALMTGALGLVGMEAGVIWADLGASAALGYPAILLACALTGLSRRQYLAQTRAARALVEQTQRTEAASRKAAALDERTRIAREIHDVLAHALGGLTVQLEAAELLLAERGDVAGALERIRGCRQTAREGLEEARRAVAALRTDTPPLPQSVAALLEEHREQGASGDLAIEGQTRELSPEVALTLMRTVQEALTNARRHAPGAAVHVRLSYEPASTSVIVTNEAAGPQAVQAGDRTSGGGYGLVGMRERLELAGGRLAAGPGPEGWTVNAVVPS